MKRAYIFEIGNKSVAEFSAYVTSLPIQFESAERHVVAKDDGYVEVDGQIEGATEVAVRVEE